MSEAMLKNYEDIGAVVDSETVHYQKILKILEKYAGGVKDKFILEIGTGIQFAQGCILCALALLDGAKRCIGVDITNPCMFCNDPRKKLFWENFCQKHPAFVHTAGCSFTESVKFTSQDVLWRDELFNKLTFMQMSASDLFFKDKMFDLVISKSVFEHIKKPVLALEEIFRVLRPGGDAFITWNPFTSLTMGGHDIGIGYYYPWAQLRLTPWQHINKLKEVYSNKSIYDTMPLAHRPNDELAKKYSADPGWLRRSSLEDLNQMRSVEFLAAARKIGFDVVFEDYTYIEEDRKYLTEEIKKELSQYSEEELLMVGMFVVFHKPA